MGPGESEFEPHGRLSAHDILEMRKHDEAEVTAPYPTVVPLDSEEVPSWARLFTLRAGITPERATQLYGVSWSAKSSRVVIPILHNGNPTGQWAGRADSGRKPKYLMPGGSVGAMWYKLGDDRGTPVIVVEDVLSAIRCTEAGYDALAVLGTSVSQQQAVMLDGREVMGWFDGDAAGRNGYVKLRKALGPFGIEPKRIQTDMDPKRYGLDQIAQYIEDAR
jgi:hypothetical protein